MDAASAEARSLAGREESWDRVSSVSQHAAVQIRLQSAERLARQHVKAHGNQWSGGRINELVGGDPSEEPVPRVGTRFSHGVRLGIDTR